MYWYKATRDHRLVEGDFAAPFPVCSVYQSCLKVLRVLTAHPQLEHTYFCPSLLSDVRDGGNFPKQCGYLIHDNRPTDRQAKIHLVHPPKFPPKTACWQRHRILGLSPNSTNQQPTPPLPMKLLLKDRVGDVQEHRHHPRRPSRRHPRDGSRRADAHHSLLPRDQHPQRARQKPGANRHWRLAGIRRRNC